MKLSLVTLALFALLPACGAGDPGVDDSASAGALRHGSDVDSSYRLLVGKWKVVDQDVDRDKFPFENNIRSMEFTDEITTPASDGTNRRIYRDVVRVELSEETHATRDDAEEGKYATTASASDRKKGSIAMNVTMNREKMDYEITDEGKLKLVDDIYDGTARKQRKVTRLFERAD